MRGIIALETIEGSVPEHATPVGVAEVSRLMFSSAPYSMAAAVSFSASADMMEGDTSIGGRGASKASGSLIYGGVGNELVPARYMEGLKRSPMWDVERVLTASAIPRAVTRVSPMRGAKEVYAAPEWPPAAVQEAVGFALMLASGYPQGVRAPLEVVNRLRIPLSEEHPSTFYSMTQQVEREEAPQVKDIGAPPIRPIESYEDKILPLGATTVLGDLLGNVEGIDILTRINKSKGLTENLIGPAMGMVSSLQRGTISIPRKYRERPQEETDLFEYPPRTSEVMGRGVDEAPELGGWLSAITAQGFMLESVFGPPHRTMDALVSKSLSLSSMTVGLRRKAQKSISTLSSSNGEISQTPLTTGLYTASNGRGALTLGNQVIPVVRPVSLVRAARGHSAALQEHKPVLGETDLEGQKSLAKEGRGALESEVGPDLADLVSEVIREDRSVKEEIRKILSEVDDPKSFRRKLRDLLAEEMIRHGFQI